jgi:serine/threonine protein kinase
MADLHAASRQAPANIGEYRLVECIGQGAMGSIFLARDTLLERDVALKVLTAKQLTDDERALFLREARALARVSNPHVVMVYRVGEFEGQAYLVTELVQGQSLEAMPKPIAWQRALAFGIGIARGLAAAHRKKVLHRDVKPANVMVSVDGDVKVVDFGLAKLVGDTELALRAVEAPEGLRGRWSRVSKSGEFVGTPLYMAPEVLHGVIASEQSDIYSVGALLYELVTGIAPRDVLPESAPLANWIDFVPAPLHGQEGLAIEKRFSQIVQRCLSRLPAERFGSAEALAEGLEAVQDDQQSGEIPEGNPYRGLEPFEMEHRGVFFGRDVEIRAVEQRLRKDALVVVAGDSGVGKSSLCKAGVLPRLFKMAEDARRTLRVLSFVPNRQPLRALQDALAPLFPNGEGNLSALLDADHAALYREMTRGLSPDEDVLLFVDQLEELCTLSDRQEAELVVDALMRACAGPHVRVLGTLRGDFITQLAAIGEFGAVLAPSLFLLRPMTEEGIRAAIIKPALRKGVTFESEELVDDLVRASAQMPGGLPLLEFALAEVWQARASGEGALLTKDALRSIGSVSGALARHADSVLNGLGGEEKTAARRVLLSLTHMKRTRARRTWDELGGHQPAVRSAIDALVRGRLIVARQLGEEGGVYEVAHEALLWEWQTLREWIEQTREQGQTAREIEEAAELWERRGRLEDETWVGDALARAVHAIEKWELDLPAVSREFLAAGLVRREKTRRRRRWIFGAASAILLGIAVVSSIAAFAFAEKEKVAVRQNELIRLAAADIGQFELVIETFDWNAKTQQAHDGCGAFDTRLAPLCGFTRRSECSGQTV